MGEQERENQGQRGKIDVVEEGNAERERETARTEWHQRGWYGIPVQWKLFKWYILMILMLSPSNE